MRSCPRYHELLRESTEAADYQEALEGWTVSAVVGLGVKQGLVRVHPTPHLHPGLPDPPGQLHGVVTGWRTTPQGMESFGHTHLSGESSSSPSGDFRSALDWLLVMTSDLALCTLASPSAW